MPNIIEDAFDGVERREKEKEIVLIQIVDYLDAMQCIVALITSIVVISKCSLREVSRASLASQLDGARRHPIRMAF